MNFFKKKTPKKEVNQEAYKLILSSLEEMKKLTGKVQKLTSETQDLRKEIDGFGKLSSQLDDTELDDSGPSISPSLTSYYYSNN